MRSWNYIHGIAMKYSQHLKTSVAFHGCLCFSGQAALMNARAWWMRPLTDLGRNDLMVDGKWGFKMMVNKQWAVPSLFFRSLELNEDVLFIFSIPHFDLKDVHGCPTCHARSITMLQPPKTIAIKSASINNQARWNRAASSNQRQKLVPGATKKAGEKWNTAI